MLISRLYRVLLLAGFIPALPAGACEVRDFFEIPLPSPTSDRSAIAIALEHAYDGVEVRDETGVVLLPSGIALSLGRDDGRHPSDRLRDASIAEQFSQTYPLDFDPHHREQPWFDPGRARNDSFFRTLWFETEWAAASSLAAVTYSGSNVKTRFSVTSARCVAAHLQAAFDAIAKHGPEMDVFFESVGGGFNWRKIAGTNRLSAHSFGIAVDLNTTLGGYWRWTGAKAGSVGVFRNQYPEALIREMERHGFIWGGKWHHFDGMHFEYRPELILHARLVAGSGNRLR